MVSLQGFIIYLLDYVSKNSKASLGQIKHPEKAELWVSELQAIKHLLGLWGTQALIRDSLFALTISLGMETFCKLEIEQIFLRPTNNRGKASEGSGFLFNWKSKYISILQVSGCSPFIHPK